ncbi:ribbon-helix-helix protein, CopG family [Campylobacter sp. RM9344]|uniref:Ribbon-helix-helix protein, CopG family n=1 Tax=Campylobacter californiensis TaxID=1032243 RepID=A0AAW3ZXN6_9BACT|nr:MULTISPECIES: ribbon-helix-helix protein, CopG family [unclassified Campylobacter]MBE2985328.1 ribbon-helix-helix protein, CopG family [Campylobacter sp. RM6883]MBE2995861.1 ribbon-helix-helix protein, CopG family [Campylobacter sp. RM6913]MBE3030296.1 ribbon-helix-helix protein, CopG family [Campylobacter sp. RM9344]MBE3608744.1 ribbon-helix-helix protein, CopG family [Campylobacter sp. RM9337]MBE3610518.1 ribbon-helix-helix protein, CopG family [Campylobacter sp. RM12916]
MQVKNKNIISVRLDDELLEKLKKDAEKEYRPLAMHIRKILIDYLVTKG